MMGVPVRTACSNGDVFSARTLSLDMPKMVYVTVEVDSNVAEAHSTASRCCLLSLKSIMSRRHHKSRCSLADLSSHQTLPSV